MNADERRFTLMKGGTMAKNIAVNPTGLNDDSNDCKSWIEWLFAT